MSNPPSFNPAYSGSQTTRAAPNQSNQAFYSGAETTRASQQYTSAKAPVQWNAIEDPPKQKLETVLCGSCGAKNGVPPGTPSFNCYKCGRTSTRPGLKQEPPPKQYLPQQKKVKAKPVQQVSSSTTPNVVVVQQPATQVVTTSTAGNQLAYGAYGGSTSSGRGTAAAAGLVGGLMLGAALSGPRYGGGYYGRGYYGGYRGGWGCRRRGFW